MMSAAVPQGYKQTEVGVIPEDWAIEKVNQLLEKKAILSHLDGNHGELYPRSSEFKQYGVPYIGANDFSDGFVTFERCKFLSNEKATQFSKGVAKDGDVLFAHNATVGPVALLKTVEPFVILSTTATYFRCNEGKLNNVYLKFALQSPHFVKQYQAVMSQSTRFQVPITAQRKFYLVTPPLPEQQAIATALSDVDALLAAQDKLIAKKRDIKQAAMQQLLTGKQRLPGFSGKWEVKRLGDILSRMANGAVYKPSNEFGVRVTRIETIADGTIDYSRTGAAELSPELVKYKLMSGDILFSHINSLDHIGKVAQFLGQRELYHGMNLLLLRANEDTDSKFLYFWFTSEPARRKTRNLAKQAVSQASINTKELKGLEIYMPQLHEQTAIATVLSDMDADLTALVQQRDKTRALKQGMMQELLTGRIRLV